MVANRTVYHVVPNSDASKWVISRENDDQFREEYETKAEAEEAATRRAKGEEPSQVKVHLENGNMEYEHTYGDDPPEIPG